MSHDAAIVDLAGIEVPGRSAEAAVGRFHLTDSGNAERFVGQHGDHVRFCHPWGRWFAWDGTRWRADDPSLVYRLAKDTIRTAYRSAAEQDSQQRKAIARFALRSESRRSIEDMLRLAQHEDGIPITPTNLDADRFLLNCTNGTIDLRTGHLRPHCRADLITRCCRCSYEPNMPTPAFDQFISDTTAGNVELERYLQAFLGYCLTGDITEQIFPVFWGEGSNGKSTLLDTLLYIMDDYATMAAPNLVAARRWSAHPTEIADLCGRRLVVASETEKGQSLRVGLVKQVTGDDRVKGRFMRQDFFEFDRAFKLILVTNNKPEVPDAGNAIWRRLRLVPFTNVVPPEEQDQGLLQRLKGEGPGILAWLVQALRWQEHGLRTPSEVENATAEYRDDTDHLQRFADDCLTFLDAATTPSARLTRSFDEWCDQEGLHLPVTDLWPFLKSKGCTSGRHQFHFGRARGWKGVGIVQEVPGA